jgi:pimeloyl-ACP methyl ester carboxylesterase
MSDEDWKAVRAAPSWAGRVAAAHTITRECRAESRARLDPLRAARITVPVLLLTGENSRDPSHAEIEAVRAVLPDARIVTIAGQEHVADVMVSDVFARHLLAFLQDTF